MAAIFDGATITLTPYFTNSIIDSLNGNSNDLFVALNTPGSTAFIGTQLTSAYDTIDSWKKRISTKNVSVTNIATNAQIIDFVFSFTPTEIGYMYDNTAPLKEYYYLDYNNGSTKNRLFHIYLTPAQVVILNNARNKVSYFELKIALKG